jgi:hypothetical protein
VSCKYDFPVQTSHVLSLQNKYKLKMKNDSGYQSSGKYLNRRVGYPVFDKRYSFLRQPSASPTYLSALSRRTTQLLRLGSKIRTNITLYQLVNLILGTINIPSYASLHNMKDSRRQEKPQSRQDDPGPPCGCFVSGWNSPEDYDENLAPVQCFPHAFPFTLFQARPLSKRSSQKSDTSNTK